MNKIIEAVMHEAFPKQASVELPVATDSIKNKLYNVGHKFGGIYNDDSWQVVHKIHGEMTKILPTLSLVDTNYKKDSDGKPTSKEWEHIGAFKTQQGKERVVWVRTVASAAGSVEEPLSRYDVTTMVEVMSPKTVQGKGRDYLETFGIKI